MKKKLLTVALASMMMIGSTMSVLAADTTTALIGKFSFEDNLKNDQGGEAVAVAQGTNATVGAEVDSKITFEDGMTGKAARFGADEGQGLNLKINPASESYTVALWAKADGMSFAVPIAWIGAPSQSTEAWTGLSGGFMNDWAMGPSIQSNDAAGTRPAATPTKGLGTDADLTKFEWTHIAYTVDNGVAILYYNGKEVARTADDVAIASAITSDSSVYISANAWDAPFNGLIDEVYVYDRALAAEDIEELAKTTGKVDESAVQQPAETQSTINIKDQQAKPQDPDQFKASEDEDEGNNMWIWIVVACVGVVVVAGVVFVATKKKK